MKRIGGVIVSVLASSAVCRGFKLLSGQTEKNICCIYAKHSALRNKWKGWLAWDQNNEWSDMSTRGLLFQ